MSTRTAIRSLAVSFVVVVVVMVTTIATALILSIRNQHSKRESWKRWRGARLALVVRARFRATGADPVRVHLAADDGRQPGLSRLELGGCSPPSDALGRNPDREPRERLLGQAWAPGARASPARSLAG